MMSEQRPIVFRARHRDSGRWCVWAIWDSILDLGAPAVYIRTSDANAVVYMADGFFDRSTLGEWTGRRDSTGRMVFEGDKMIATYERADLDDGTTATFKGTIWYDECSRWRFGDEELSEWMCNAEDATFTVVGTIHDEKGDA